ncbi:MAG: hypothetical protein N2246_07020 [Candidatus Sumerlaeia bacterium]|nr:hypothetical protein [Candidatus Sumerlaeia bacterium]
MLKIILNEDFINILFIILAVVLPAIAILFYLFVGRKKSLSPLVKFWLIIIGIAGPANLALWHLYNFIENTFGLDSVKALLINLLIFILLAVCASLVLARLYARLYSAYIPPEHPDESFYKKDQPL